MKPLSVLIFAALTAVACAESAALRPLEPFSSTPSPLLAPRLPVSSDEPSQEIVRGQSRSVSELAGYLSSPLPLAQGAVEEGTIEPKLTGTSDLTEWGSEVFPESNVNVPTPPILVRSDAKLPDSLDYAVLLMVAAVPTIGLVIMVFIALDYRQRWMQTSTMQNDRYVGGAFDMEDTFGLHSGSPSFSEGFGLSRRSI